MCGGELGAPWHVLLGRNANRNHEHFQWTSIGLLGAPQNTSIAIERKTWEDLCIEHN